MRLLNTKTYDLSSFQSHVPPYAILSHTWRAEEVLYADVFSDACTRRQGWAKLENCCRQAVRDGWEWVWVDTCCIDKSDSSELSEAINSMFQWYEEAQVCYAFLEDVPKRYFSEAGAAFPWKWYFRSSRWFKRGWTLQELLAPTCLLFFDGAWNPIGSRESWADEISLVTGIGVRQFLDFKSCSVATKLSWAARRETTRVEDRAYSLLGLLGVHMPLIYGEGKKAFVRLQHELMRQYNDETIFLWGEKPTAHMHHFGRACASLFAESPDDYSASNGLVVWPFDKERRGFAVSNAGLSIRGELFEEAKGGRAGTPLFAIQLNCTWEWPPTESFKSPMMLPLFNTPPGSAFFQRAGAIIRSWREANATYSWQSLGKRDILIVPPQDDGRLQQIQSSGILAWIAPSDGQPGLPKTKKYGTHEYFLHSGTQKWSENKTEYGGPSGSISSLNRSHVLSFKLGALLAPNTATISRIGVTVQGARTPVTFGIIIKAVNTFPAVGIWRMSESEHTLEDLVSYLSWDIKERRYPDIALLGSGRKVIRATPKPAPVREPEMDARALKAKLLDKEREVSPHFKVTITKHVYVEIAEEQEVPEWAYISTYRATSSQADSDSDARPPAQQCDWRGNPVKPLPPYHVKQPRPARKGSPEVDEYGYKSTQEDREREAEFEYYRGRYGVQARLAHNGTMGAGMKDQVGRVGRPTIALALPVQPPLALSCQRGTRQ
ncbi:heterokaryon incompatibility protein-domain-containing protein [Lasiosphaeris hirsuta]|uniref:Heterokaryon incompatibility protein-domain-containing protein n=1 Tax=Lasiosphaeris hirsuta TaxID=260670 RepID=A0AA40DN35_9PEZI|nr:heterokaryon incompatibility protein-domain-containing protein [Lasiosphaeris hirsuta]